MRKTAAIKRSPIRARRSAAAGTFVVSKSMKGSGTKSVTISAKSLDSMLHFASEYRIALAHLASGKRHFGITHR